MKKQISGSLKRNHFLNSSKSIHVSRFKKLLLIIILATGSLSLKAQTSMNISTPNGWTPYGSPLATISNSPFAGHTNWIKITNVADYTTYKFKRTFYVCKEGNYTVQLKGFADNKITVKVDNNPPFWVHNITSASQFNTPVSREVTAFLKCGKHEINLEVYNEGGPAGFYLDAMITSKDGKLNEKECCLVKVMKCKCPEDWYSNNSTSKLGGQVSEASERQCKKLICKPIGISPLPADGTQLTGNIGFTWGDELWFYGTKENGGWPLCTEEWVDPSVPNKETKPGQGRGRARLDE